ncbi:hypothetical protein HMPREF9413_1414 [Paenibacillus sp. HGF7]|nr:hypothetical protein HMPREF9413_1414 [Paenibacillus sp. HGF7]EPD90103.1 hypothetical protein HMPREF1207_01372 [Paenibacillus sp. HGH0039]
MVYLGGMERGERNITLENLAKIAQALNVEVMELLNFNSSGTEDDDIIVAVTAALRDRSTEDKRRILQIINLIPKSGE